MKRLYFCNGFRNEMQNKREKQNKDNNNSLKFYDYEKVHLFSMWLYTRR